MSDDVRLLAKRCTNGPKVPLGAHRRRVCGTIDIEKPSPRGKAFEPGLLAKANRGIYVDEVNLLDDHLVDVLDSAASGWNTVEREGISIRHPARFVLVGSATRRR